MITKPYFMLFRDVVGVCVWLRREPYRLWMMILMLCFATFSRGQNHVLPGINSHILTVYAMKSLKPLDWDSPASLVKSTTRGYKAKLLHHRQYLLGHMIIRLESPLIGGTEYASMVSTSMKEKRILMLREKIGLGILGIAMEGKLDSEEEIRKDLKLFSRIGKLAYVKYYISEEAARRIILFMEGFSRAEEGHLPPCSYYGGAFWPRYLGEGAGCTAYGICMLELAGLMGIEHHEWKVEVNIPVDLVGGGLNQDKKVSRREILKSGSWALSGDSSSQAFIPFTIYDPSIVFDWVHEVRSHNSDGYVSEEEGTVPGLVADKRHIKPNVDEPVFMKRPQPSLFIDYFERQNSR